MANNYEERREELIKRFKKLRDEAAEDIKFSKANLDAAFDSTEKTMKWLGKRAQWLQLFHSYEFKRQEAWKKSYEYYKSDYPFTLNTKDEYKNMINVDPAYSEINDLKVLTGDIVDFIDATLDALKSRQWEIKLFVEWQRFQAGLS